MFRLILLLLIPACLVVHQANSQNYVTTYAGTGSPGFQNGDTSVAKFNQVFGICIDPEGNIYLGDAANHRIRKISTSGLVSTYAGSGTAGFQDGPADEAKFNQPFNLCMDDSGNMYVSDFLNQRIRKISADMEVTTVAGTGSPGHENGPADQAKFNYPRGICLDEFGNLYVGDSWNHRIRKISVDGMVSDWAGGGTTIGVQSVGDYVDASDTAARFYTPCELSIDQYNNIYVADAYNHRIRRIDPQAVVTTVAGSGGFGPDGGGFQNGPVDEAQFNVPTACHVIPDGTIFVGDGSNQQVREISIYNTVSTFAGSGEAGFEDGTDTLAKFDFPRGSVFDINLNRLYVVDYNNHAVRIVHFVPTVGMDDEAQKQEIRIFPNPAEDQVTLVLPSDITTCNIQLCDQSGHILKSIDTNNIDRIQLDLSEFDAGVYFVRVISEDRIISSEKVIVGL